MYVIALVDFHDNFKDVDRKVGEEFVVSEKRFAEINSVAEIYGLEAIVAKSSHEDAPEDEAPKDEASEEAPKKPRRTRAKKTTEAK